MSRDSEKKGGAMNHLIVYAHPNPKSFNHAILSAVEENLKKAGREFLVRDLYALKFSPVLAPSDFAAFHEGNTPDDIKREQEFITSADRIVVIHPIWWFGMPAMLKGYIDRVFAHGFAYSVGPDGPKGLLSGKKVSIINTTGGDEATYSKYGFRDALARTIENGVFGFCGMEVVQHKFFYAVPTSTDEQRKRMLEEVASLAL